MSNAERKLRAAWYAKRPVHVALSGRCEIPSIEGRVTYVASSGAYVEINGWHVPIQEIRRVTD